jgi:type II secretory pathway pseudopilin PulG
MKKHGFVLIELAVVFGMLAALIGMTTINIFGSQRKASLTATIDTLVADVRSQQTKAMTGTTDNSGLPPAYGVHFDGDRYVLFRGASYSSSLSSNAIIPLDSRVRFSNIQFANGNIIFASRSGDFIGYASASSSLTVNQLDSGEVKIIQLNRYGVISSIN